MVERSNLAALEFLMSKQPRGNVRVGAGNTGGVRVSNIFVDVDKFQTRFQEEMEKASKSSKETDLQRESRMSAIQAIRSISNWLYWQSPGASGSSSRSPEKSLTRVVYRLPEPDISKLRDAAARKKVRDIKKAKNQIPANSIHPEEYWAPSAYALPSSATSTASPPKPVEKKTNLGTKGKKERDERETETYENQNSPFRWGLPVVTALTGLATVRLHEVESIPELKQHVAGSLALQIVNSSWLQYILAAATWYMIGMAIVELVVIVGNRDR